MTQEPQNPYPVSRFLSDPVARGTSSGVMTAANLAVLRELGRRGTIKGVREGFKNLKNKNILLAGLASGLGTGIFTSVARRSYPDTIQKKLRSGGDFTAQEKKLLLKGIKTRKGDGKKSFGEHLFSPVSMGLAGAGLYGGGILTKKPGIKPALLGAALFGGGALLDRLVMTRGLAARAKTGKGLTDEERALVEKLKAVRQRNGGRNA